MPWIKTVKPEEAIGALKEVLNKRSDPDTHFSSLTDLVSIKSQYAILFNQEAEEIWSPDWKLSQAQREMIGTVTSAIWRCHS